MTACPAPSPSDAAVPLTDQEWMVLRGLSGSAPWHRQQYGRLPTPAPPCSPARERHRGGSGGCHQSGRPCNRAPRHAAPSRVPQGRRRAPWVGGLNSTQPDPTQPRLTTDPQRCDGRMASVAGVTSRGHRPRRPQGPCPLPTSSPGPGLVGVLWAPAVLAPVPPPPPNSTYSATLGPCTLPCPAAPYCTAPHCTALHCSTPLYCTALYPRPCERILGGLGGGGGGGLGI